MNDIISQVALGIVSTIVIGLMAFMTSNLIKLLNRIIALEISGLNTEKWLAKISSDIHSISLHDAAIAVLNDNMKNAKTDINVIFEQMRELEKRESDRNANTLYRRQ